MPGRKSCKEKLTFNFRLWRNLTETNHRSPGLEALLFVCLLGVHVYLCLETCFCLFDCFSKSLEVAENYKNLLKCVFENLIHSQGNSKLYQFCKNRQILKVWAFDAQPQSTAMWPGILIYRLGFLKRCQPSCLYNYRLLQSYLIFSPISVCFHLTKKVSGKLPRNIWPLERPLRHSTITWCSLNWFTWFPLWVIF